MSLQRSEALKVRWLGKVLDDKEACSGVTSLDLKFKKNLKILELICCKKWQKKDPVKKLVWGIVDV